MDRATPEGGEVALAERRCPKGGKLGPVEPMFGTRRMRRTRTDGTESVMERPQSYCKACRKG